jgi:hypothetical protein
MSTVKNQKKEKKRQIDSLNIFLCLFGLHLQGNSILNNHRFDLFCSGSKDQKTDFRYLLIQEGYITREMIEAKRASNGFLYHRYSITEKGLKYLKNSFLYKRCQIPEKIDNKIKFALISLFEKLKGYSGEAKVQAIFYFFAIETYKIDSHKLTSAYLYGSNWLVSTEQMHSTEYKRTKARFNRIIDAMQIKSKIPSFVLRESSLLKKNNYKRINKSILNQNNKNKAKAFFIDKVLLCASHTVKKVFKNFLISPFVKKTKSLLKNFFGTIPLKAIFKKHLTLIENNPTNEQLKTSLLDCDRYLQMGALMEHERFKRIITKRSKHLSDFEKQKIIARNHTDNGLSQYIVEDLQLQKPEKKIWTILETIHHCKEVIQQNNQESEYSSEYSEDQIEMMQMNYF